MNRVIKFRAWDKEQKYMAYQGLPDLETLQSFMHHFGDCELMQLTGLHDCTKWDELTTQEQHYWLKDNKQEDWKGKPIYEGDVVSGSGYAEPLKRATKFNLMGEIKYSINDAGFCVKWYNTPSKCRTTPHVKQVKIIGNVFEHLNLIERSNDE